VHPYELTFLPLLQWGMGITQPARTCHNLHATHRITYQAAGSAVHIEVVKQLLKSGYEVDQRDDEGDTPLHVAIKAGEEQFAGPSRWPV
jgi:ankyrin repeat protein